MICEEIEFMKIITLEEQVFDDYASKHRYRNFYQTSAYGKTMEKQGYEIHYLGIVNDNGTLIGATLLLFKEVFMNYKIAYAPRGILFDYTNSLLLQEFTVRLKKLLGKQNFLLLKIDPLIPVAIHNENGDIINVNPEANVILNNLLNNDFQYHGQTLHFESEKARFEAIVTLNKDIKLIFKDFDKKVRYKIKKATRSGVEVILGTKEDIDTFYEFVKRKYDRPASYYHELYKNFHDHIDLYLAKLNTETFVIDSKQLYEKELENNDLLAKKIQDAPNNLYTRKKLINQKIESDKLLNTYKKNLVWSTKLLKEYPNGLIIGGALCIRYDQAAFMVIEGFNQKFKSLHSNYLIKWKMLSNYKNLNFKYVNLNAISGDFKKSHQYSGLNEMKLGFQPVITEYIGEFDCIINPIPYNLYRNLNKKK